MTANLTYYRQEQTGEPKTMQTTIAPGEVKVLDNLLESSFGETGDSLGAIHVTAAGQSTIVATARTYTDAPDRAGTYGLVLPSVTVADTVGTGERSLQVLQVEESDRFRSNLAMAEVSGKPATVEATITVPDAKFATVVRFEMGANEYRQVTRILRQVNLTEVDNARISIRVIAGEGRITAYSAVIDNKTGDPTYAPAQ